MNFKKYHVSRNLFDVNKEWTKLSNTDTVIVSGNSVTITSKYYAKVKMPVPRNMDCVIKANVFEEGVTTTGNVAIYESDSSTRITYREISEIQYVSFNTGNNDEIWVYLYAGTGTEKTKTYSEIMLNTGSQPLPYEPYSSEVWHDAPHYIHNTSTNTITTLPAVLYPTGTTATVGLKGNTVQSTTPTPQNPVMPNGTGERTGNLWNEDYSNVSVALRYVSVNVGNGDFTLSTNCPISGGRYPCLFFLAGQVTSGASTGTNDVRLGVSRTVTAIDGYVTIAYRGYTDVSPVDYDTMLNSGSTSLPYEPYGYKIPISSANTTTPVYLGEVQTTRKIGKIDLGTLSWSKTASGNFWADTSISDCRTIGNTLSGNAICTHFTEVRVDNVANTPYSFSSCLNTVARPFVNKTGFENLTGEEFKQAMSGVYMYYVLATEETGIVNEPLMKIGDYADSLSNVSIPVTTGGDTLSVGTTLQPSEVTVNYKGWHPVQSVHEKSVNLAPPLAEWVDGYVNQSDGSITPPGGATKEKTSDYIAIQAGQGYSFSRTGSFPVGGYGAWRGIGWYDSNKAFISRAQGSTQDALSTSAPSNAAYCRICFRTYGETTDTMFNKGLTALPYEPFWT